MTGVPNDRRHLVYFGNILRKCSDSLAVFAHVSIGNYKQNIERYRDEHLGGFLQSGTPEFPSSLPKVKGFFEAVIAENLRQGTQMLVQLSGLGRLKPNVVVMGYKENWRSPDESEKIKEYVSIIRDCFDMNLGVMVPRGLDRFDWTASSVFDNKETPFRNEETAVNTIDIWWLIDDGGLTVLIPHLLSLHSYFRSDVPIRLLPVVDNEADWAQPLLTMTLMIEKFRLNMIVESVETRGKGPAARHVGQFEKILGKTVGEMKRSKTTERWIRVGELMRQKSRKSIMNFVTMPYPRADYVADEFMAILEWMSSDGMPPTIFMRGANQNVLTYYLE